MKKVKLKDIANIYNGNSINARVKAEKYCFNVPAWNYIGTKDIDFDGTVNYDTGVKIPFEEKGFKIAPANCVFVCSEGGSAGKKTAHITQEVCFGNKLYAIVNNKNLFVSKYVYYYTRYREFFEQFKALMSGIIGGVSSKKFGEIEIPLLSLQKQQRIVEKIEELFSKLDKGVEELNKIKEQLKIYRQAVLDQAFDNNETEVHLRDISTVISGYAFKSGLYDANGKYVVVKIGNVKQHSFDFSRDLTKTNEANDNILSKYLLKKGDCLITMTGSRGKRDYGFVTMIDKEENFLLNQRVAALRFDKISVDTKFFEYYLSTTQFRNQFFSYETGNVGQGNVGVKALTESTVICPKIELQKHIVKEIESRLSVCEKIEQTVNESLQKAESLRQSILKKAFEGKLV